jgi:uncharacterized YccA/Bax inhibitor family protein
MANPSLSTQAFRRAERVGSPADVMTLGGTVVKTGILLLILIAAGALSWPYAYSETADSPYAAVAVVMLLLGCFGGLVLALVTIFVPRLSPITAPLYAACEGLLLGVISAMYERQFHGLVTQAALLTVGVLLVMLMLYATRIIQPTARFVMGVAAATLAVALFYLLVMILSLFGVGAPLVELVYGNSLLSIGFSILVAGIAALNLIIDFGQIERGVAMGAPKYMEWYGGFGLLVTLVWLYLEILRLLAKIRSRD